MSAEKMIAALARHERAHQAVAGFKVRIGDALALCPVSVKYAEQADLPYSEFRTEAMLDNRGYVMTHLNDALTETSDDGYGLDAEEINDYLHDEDTGCEHCLQAWRHIIERKAARQELGNARRLIRFYGKQAMAMQDGAP